MLARILVILTVAGGLLLGLFWSPAPAAATSPAAGSGEGTFTIDVVHSMLMFKLRHFGVSYFYGRVNQPSGSFRIDEDDLAGSFVHVTAQIKNMDTGNGGRDRFIMSPDFFNVREHPTAEFRSTSVRAAGPGRYEATGDLTMHGITNPVTVDLAEYTTLQTERFGFRGGFECRFTVKRSEFGMNLFVEEGTLGDEVTILAAVEGVVQPPE